MFVVMAKDKYCYQEQDMTFLGVFITMEKALKRIKDHNMLDSDPGKYTDYFIFNSLPDEHMQTLDEDAIYTTKYENIICKKL
jgi:hypothetical protein